MTLPALELREVSKRFGSVIALEDVSLTTRYGSVHALLGENGAGKTTLMRIAFGLVRPDSGSIAINGEEVALSTPADAIAAGVGMVHQQFSLVPAMTVAENVALGGDGRFSFTTIATRIHEIGKRTGLLLDPAARVADLGSADRQKLEIIRTLAHDARILILDEPTAVLTPADTAELFTQLRSFADAGGCVVLITHKLRDAVAHADEVTILRRGRVVMNAPMSGIDEIALQAAMIGEAPPSTAVSRDTNPAEPGEPVVVLDQVSFGAVDRTKQEPLNLRIEKGEILGIAALEGSARSLLRILAGIDPPAGGTVITPGQPGFVPENRHDEGIIPEFTLAENLALRGAGERKGLLDWDDMKTRTAAVVENLAVTTSSVTATMQSLSGGNQQRFILGRELEGNSDLLVLENPTQGLDVKATAAIHTRMRAAAVHGTAVVFYSSDLDEIAELADRVLVVTPQAAILCEPDRHAIGRLLLLGTPAAEESSD